MLTKPDLNKPYFKIFTEKAEDVRNGICPFCKEPISPDSFKDELSRKEYSISGLCQICQDATYGRY